MIPAGGYQWHYIDGVSDDGRSAIVIIALLGNPFSPSYARARQRGPSPALTFCSMNVAVYAKGASAWALDEQSVADDGRTASGVAIGRSSMRWGKDGLTVDLDELTTPLRRRLRGKIVLHPEVQSGLEIALDEGNEHKWWPVAPLARIEVDLPSPGVRFSGHGYHDANAGNVPLETSFEHWSWSRARTEDGALLTYDLSTAAGSERSLSLRVSPQGELDNLDGTWRAPLPNTLWGIERQARVDDAHGARLQQSLEDGPFYSRALVETRLGGRPVVAVHETLAAHRLRRSWVRALVGFRMRRAR